MQQTTEGFAPNPPYDECRCSIVAPRGVEDDGRESDARAIHDMILAINDRPVEAIEEIMREIRDGVLFAGRGGILDVTGFETIFAQHRFHDQVGTYALAQQLELMRMANQVHLREDLREVSLSA